MFWIFVLYDKKTILFSCPSFVLIVKRVSRYPEDTANDCPTTNIRFTVKVVSCVHAGGGSSGCPTSTEIVIGSENGTTRLKQESET